MERNPTHGQWEERVSCPFFLESFNKSFLDKYLKNRVKMSLPFLSPSLSHAEISEAHTHTFQEGRSRSTCEGGTI